MNYPAASYRVSLKAMNAPRGGELTPRGIKPKKRGDDYDGE